MIVCILWVVYLGSGWRKGQNFRSFCLLEELLFLNTYWKWINPQPHPDRVSLSSSIRQERNPMRQRERQSLSFPLPSFPAALSLNISQLSLKSWPPLGISRWLKAKWLYGEAEYTLWPETYITSFLCHLYQCLIWSGVGDMEKEIQEGKSI